MVSIRSFALETPILMTKDFALSVDLPANNMSNPSAAALFVSSFAAAACTNVVASNHVSTPQSHGLAILRIAILLTIELARK